MSEDIAVGDAQRGGEARAPRNRPDGWNRYRDLRHLSVDFLCSFMDSGEEGMALGQGSLELFFFGVGPVFSSSAN